MTNFLLQTFADLSKEFSSVEIRPGIGRVMASLGLDSWLQGVGLLVALQG